MTSDNITGQKSAKIYGQSGALKALLEKIHAPKVQSLDDVLHFRKNRERSTDPYPPPE